MTIAIRSLFLGIVFFGFSTFAQTGSQPHVVDRTFQMDLQKLSDALAPDTFETGWTARIAVYPENELDALIGQSPGPAALLYFGAGGLVKFSIDASGYSVWLEGHNSHGQVQIPRETALSLLATGFASVGLDHRPVIGRVLVH